ncbi:MAG: (5-formylfuran-3-yl)methyl phosphate synthase [Planctomycetota bacterium]
MTQKTEVEVLTGKTASDNDAPGSRDHFRSHGLLVSASEQGEWDLAIRAGVDWIDLKNPRNGPLGRPDFAVACEFADRMRDLPDHRWSLAGGELRDWNPIADRGFGGLLGDRGCIKWALAGCANGDEWREKLSACLLALPGANQAILVHYADHPACAAPPWESVLQAACDAGMRYILIDTAIKDGRSLMDHLSQDLLRCHAEEARSLGLEVAIAGSLRLDQLPMAGNVGASWVGVRGAVCRHADRSSPFCREKLERAVAIVRGCVTPQRRESVHVLG